MSTKTFNLNPYSYSSPLLFILISIVIHALLIYSLSTMPSSFAKAFKADKVHVSKKPLIVDVVELPPDAEGIEKEPESETALASNRSLSVKEEHVTKGTRTARLGNTSAESITPPAPSPLAIPSTTPSLESVSTRLDTAPELTERATSEDNNAATEKDSARIIDNEEALDYTKKDEEELKLFPTKERLRKLAKAGRSSRAQEPGPKVSTLSTGGPPEYARHFPIKQSVSLNTSNLKYYKYVLNIKHRIYFYWRYPLASAKKGHQGDLKVDFKILKDGTLEVIEVKSGSGYPALDDAVIKALKLASPFNPFPEDFETENIVINGTFTYSLL
jgi:protein TonB